MRATPTRSELHNERRTMSSVIEALESVRDELRQCERDRSVWQIEKMQLLEEVGSLKKELATAHAMKASLARRVKMLELALTQERLKTIGSSNTGEKMVAVLQHPDEIKEKLNEALATRPLYSEVPTVSAHTILQSYISRLQTVLPSAAQNASGLAALEASANDAENAAMPSSLEELEHHLSDRFGSDALARMMRKSAKTYVNAAAAHQTSAPPPTNPVAGKPLDDPNAIITPTGEIAVDSAKTQQPAAENASSSSSSSTANGTNASSGSSLQAVRCEDFDREFGKQLFFRERSVLRSHFDSVRTVVFPGLSTLAVPQPRKRSGSAGNGGAGNAGTSAAVYALSASDDCTVKLWSLNPVLDSALQPSDASSSTPTGGSGDSKPPTSGAPELEPVYTYRGHEGAVLAVCCSGDGVWFYSAGTDATVRKWSVLPGTGGLHKMYSALGRSIKYQEGFYEGHTDAVHALSLHEDNSRLLSASADGTIKLWGVGDEPTAPKGLLQSYSWRLIGNTDDYRVPTMVHWLHFPSKNASEAQSLATYDKFVACFDVYATVEDMEEVTRSPPLRSVLVVFDASASAGSPTWMLDDPNCKYTFDSMKVHHTEKNILFLGRSDGAVLVVDMNESPPVASNCCSNNAGLSGSVTTIIGHRDSVSGLDVSPCGKLLATTAQDGECRVWNWRKGGECLQKFDVHHRKYEESALSCAFHPHKPILATSGADATVHLFALETA